ncbi:MAG: ATP-binding protein [Frankiales bacterium]|nr:ATP-binding protein [Frankiales bacterium]
MQARISDVVGRIALAADRRRPVWAAAQLSAPSSADSTAQLDALLAVLRADYAEVQPQFGDDQPGDQMSDMADVFALDKVDITLLSIAAAPDLDANLGLAFGLLRGVSGAGRATVGLALELAGVPTLAGEGFDRLGPDSALRRHCLLEVFGSEPWLGRLLRVPDSVAAWLAGSDQTDPAVARLRIAGVPLRLPQTELVARAVQDGAPLVWVAAPTGTAGASLAAGAFAALGLPSLLVDARRCPPGEDLLGALAAAGRDAGLRGCGLVVCGAEVLADPAYVQAFDLLERTAVPVVAVGSRPWNPSWLRRFPLVVDAEPLSIDDRLALWRSSLGELAEQDAELRQALLGLRLTPEDVVETARYARVLATARDEPLSAAVVRDAARRVGGSGHVGGNRVTVTGGSHGGPMFSDLVLAEHATASLHRLVAWARHRDQVTARGPQRSRGRGISALFTGSPGTGKTLAAQVIAEELSLDLFQVDLSAVVDKYIGETEKNLERVFQAAEALDVVLFFDEADALFGSRSEVRDARDRYANQEVAYLLQRMEHFDGITILATNLRGNLDQAFSRRMSFIVHFPDPDAETRARLWQNHIAQLDELDPKDPILVESLAEKVELAGGDIRNIVLSAAYDAVSDGQPIGMRHIVAATIGEYRKLGRRIPEGGFV